MESFTQGIVRLNVFLWGAPMLTLIVGISLYFTCKLHFIQKHLFSAISLSIKKSRSAGVISSFGALVVALAAMVGTGNIVGVSAAVSTGGPGALFWMMLSAFLAMATKYAESVLSVKYRETNEAGEYVGGPMYVLKNGLNMKKTALVFAAATALMGFGDALIQTNSLAAIYGSVFSVPAYLTTAVLVLLTGSVILGGVRKIAALCKWLVPGMAVLYIVLCLTVLILHWEKFPWAVVCIFKSAFSGTALVGGAIGITLKEAVRYGVSRGVLSNEAGSGSGAIAAAAAPNAQSGAPRVGVGYNGILGHPGYLFAFGCNGGSGGRLAERYAVWSATGTKCFFHFAGRVVFSAYVAYAVCVFHLGWLELLYSQVGPILPGGKCGETHIRLMAFNDVFGRFFEP